MGEWIGLVVAFLVGVPLLAVAVWFDVRRRRRLEGPPASGEGSHVTASEIAAMPAPPAGTAPSPEGGTTLPFGFAAPGFANASGRAELEQVRVLVVTGSGVTMRDLLIPISRHKPLVIVAEHLDQEVIDTLVANFKALRLPVLVVLPQDVQEVAELTGAEPLEAADLKAGYVPQEALGRVGRWVSDGASTRVVG
ncbi:MAG: hypothetical protein Q4D96_03820 [Propionibacteriaceae bacterium]|nr:hypothetical protein [Propionibacteriaceae bacterium]